MPHDVEDYMRPSDEHYALIGRFISEWAALEADVSGMLSRALRLNLGQGIAFSNSIRSFPALLKCVAALWRHVDEDVFQKELKPIIVEIEKLYSMRNRLAHRPWFQHDDDTLSSYIGNEKSDQILERKEIKIDELREGIYNISHQREWLAIFYSRNRDLVFSSQDKLTPGRYHPHTGPD